MVSLLKNQILKHLSRFTKNLSPDKINLSAFKGEGELTGLELDEIVLTDLLELPTWLRLTSAWCNKVAFRIQWTRLKNVPIHISLDEVDVQIETCEELRSLSAQQGLSSYGTPTKYNFINKVIDGMTIFVNVVSITFKTPAFTASVQIMQILVESKSPEWKREELPQTRVKDKKKEQILIFKELKWETLRLEASSIKDHALPPLRLLTNKSRCRLTIKKRMSDCFVMGCKLLLILENLLWVLTDSQLKAVLHFAESLSGLVQKANEITRIKKAARKLEMLPEYQAQVSQQARVGGSDNKEQLFVSCDVVETSYHFLAHNINLHLSDDPGAGRSFHPLLSNGSNLHLQVSSLQIDYYPYHLAAPCDRKHWARYNEASSPHTQWLNSAQSLFKNTLLNLLKNSNRGTPIIQDGRSPEKTDEKMGSGDAASSGTKSSSSAEDYIIANLAKVMTSCLILRIDDFTVFRVTTSNSQIPKEFVKGDRERYTFPAEATVHAEFTYFYYPGDIAFPLPSPKFYVQINPVVLNFDAYTALWLNAFALNLHHSLKKSSRESTTTPLNYIDVRIQAIMPRLVFESAVDTQCGQRDRPKSLHIQTTRALITNVRSSDGCSRADLSRCIDACQMGSLFYGSESADGPVVIPEKFINHVQGKDNVRAVIEDLQCESVDELIKKLSKTLLWTEARDVWCINLQPIWGDFFGARGVAHNRPVPFLDAFPLKLWATMDLGMPASFEHTSPVEPLSLGKAQINGLAYTSNLVSFQLNHYQLLFLLRLADDLTEVVTVLELDTQRITGGEGDLVVFGCVIPQVEITLVMPSQTPGKESSGADLESVVPDTSSLADDIVTNPSIQWNSVLTTNLQDGCAYRRDNTMCEGTPPSDQISYSAVSPSKVDSPKTINTIMGLSSVKKGLSNLSSLFDGVQFKGDDSSETGSVRPDSSDSDYNLCFKLVQGDLMFRSESIEDLNDVIDVGSEALEEDEQSLATLSVTTPSENPSNTSYYKRKDLISIATVKLGQLEVVQYSQGLTSTIRAHVSNVQLEECPAIPWDEFQNKFNARSRGWTEVCEQPSLKPHIKVRREHRMESTMMPTLTSSDLWTVIRNHSLFDDMLTVSVSNLSLALNASTLSSMAEFFMDDIASPPLPMKIDLENITINLNDNKTDNAGGNTPVGLNVFRLSISRNKDGAFNIEPLDVQKVSPISQETIDLKQENDLLRRKLATMERLKEENHRLRKCEEEAQELRSCLNEAQDSLTGLLHEKESLLELLRNFQNNKTDRKQQSSGKR